MKNYQQQSSTLPPSPSSSSSSLNSINQKHPHPHHHHQQSSSIFNQQFDSAHNNNLPASSKSLTFSLYVVTNVWQYIFDVIEFRM